MSTDHDHEHCITSEGVALGCPNYDDPVPEREGAPRRVWCESHQRRHVAREPDERDLPAGAYLAINYPPRKPRVAYVDPVCGHELLVLTIDGGRLCASYDDDDLDAAARRLLDQLVDLARVTPPPGDDPRGLFTAHTFDCAHVEAHGTCSSAVTTTAGAVGPWHQLVELGWRRNGEGAWQCPTHSPAATS